MNTHKYFPNLESIGIPERALPFIDCSTEQRSYRATYKKYKLHPFKFKMRQKNDF